MRVRMEDSVVRSGKSYIPGKEYDLPDGVAARLAERGTVTLLDEPEEQKRTTRQTRKGLGGAPENKATTGASE